MCSWDSSIHDSVHLNRVTPANERVYLILKCIVRLSHPASMELVLRKRVCINVYKRQSLTDKLKKRIGKSVSQCCESLYWTDPGTSLNFTPDNDVVFPLFGNNITYLSVEYAIQNSIWICIKQLQMRNGTISIYQYMNFCIYYYYYNYFLDQG